MTEALKVGAAEGDVTLVELVNRVVDRGVVLSGEITISVAEVDLLYLALRLLLCSPDRIAGNAIGSAADTGADPPSSSPAEGP